MLLPNAISPIKYEGAGIFDIAQLGLNLDFRAPLSAISNAERSTNGLFAFADNIGSQPDINCIIDQSRNKSLTTLWASNFSAGIDGTIAQGSTLDGNIDSIGGEDDTLRVTGDAGTSATGFQKSASLTGMLKIVFRTFRPAASTTITTLRVTPSSALSTHFITMNTDVWETHEIYLYSNTANIFWQFTNGTHNINLNDNGDIIYFKDIVVSGVGGFHCFNATAAAEMAHWNSTRFSAIGDGVDDNMGMTNLAGWKTEVDPDTAGMFSFMFYDTAGAGVETLFEGFGAANGVGYMQIMRLLSSNVFQWTINVAGVTNSISYDITAFRGGWIKIQVGSTGSGYQLYVNGTLVSHSETINGVNGHWINAIASAVWSVFALFKNRVGTSYPYELRACQYISGRVFTAAEIAQINASPLYTA